MNEKQQRRFYEQVSGLMLSDEERRQIQKENEEFSKEVDREYRQNLPGICKGWLEKEIIQLERKELSMLSEKEAEWRKDKMLGLLKVFLTEDCSIYSSAGMSEEWLRKNCEEMRRRMNIIAKEE